MRATTAMSFSVRFRTAFPRLVRRGPGKVGALQGASEAPLESSRESLSYQGHSGLPLREGEEREVRAVVPHFLGGGETKGGCQSNVILLQTAGLSRQARGRWMRSEPPVPLYRPENQSILNLRFVPFMLIRVCRTR